MQQNYWYELGAKRRICIQNQTSTYFSEAWVKDISNAKEGKNWKHWMDKIKDNDETHAIC